ncbi:hypothetical protein KJN74_00970, partial [Candidatus Bathyarchaeota archaeon]|nr:hypothetical protein [Candidatus Bathyarchaeota archaeon]
LKPGLIGIIAVGIVVRSTSFFGLIVNFYDKPKGKKASWFSILANKDLIYYLLPWLAFNLAGELVVLIWEGLLENPSYVEAYDIGNVLRMAAIAFLGPVAGVIADRIGRKPPIIFALVMLGIGFGFLGLET